MAALSWLMNLGFAGSSTPAPVVAAEPAVDKGRDSGGGRPLQYVDPWELYGRPKKRLKVQQRREKIRAVRKQAQATADVVLPDLAEVSRDAQQLASRIGTFERNVERARTEAQAAKYAEEYRVLTERAAQVDAEIARIEHHMVLLDEDRQFIELIAKLL